MLNRFPFIPTINSFLQHSIGETTDAEKHKRFARFIREGSKFTKEDHCTYIGAHHNTCAIGTAWYGRGGNLLSWLLIGGRGGRMNIERTAWFFNVTPPLLKKINNLHSIHRMERDKIADLLDSGHFLHPENLRY